MSADRPVYVVGLDGVPPALLSTGIDQGRLPTLERMREEGAAGTTESTVPMVSMMAWSTFSTGRNPGNHGIYNFILKEPRGHGVRFPDADLLRRNAGTLWEYADAMGVASGVVNVMPGYPVYRTRGYHVADHITAPRGATLTHPPDLQDRLDGALDGFSPTLPADYTTDQGEAALEDYLDRFFAGVEDNVAAAKHLVEAHDCPLTVHVFSGPDVLLHNVGHLVWDSHPEYDPDLAAAHGDAPLELLERYDAFLKWLTDTADDDATVIVLSDHGHGPVHHSFDIGAWLYCEGFLSFRSRPWTRLKLFGYEHLFERTKRLMETLGLYSRLKHTAVQSTNDDSGIDWMELIALSQQDVDWSESAAYTVAADGQVYLNTEDDGGIVGDSEYESVRATLRDRLAAVRNPDRDEPVVADVIDGEDLYRGRFESTRPDLVCVPEPGYEILHPQTMQVGTLFGAPQNPSSHASLAERDGIFLASGPGVDSTADVTMPLRDYAPTILHLLGVPVPAAMDGDVRTDVFGGDADPEPERRAYDGRIQMRRSARAVADDLIE